MEPAPVPSPQAGRLALAAFLACLVFHFCAALVGWESRSLPGVEFRQTQTALSAYWIKAENNFSLAYPTPVLGKAWSIPMEFPLYQWTVVWVDRLTNLGLTGSGRLVSLACFYLLLPAVFLLLGFWDIAAERRWLVLAVLVTCPFYIFYARAFLIETMALMFALWFWVAFRFAVERRSPGWLAMAVVAGTGAGLVKATTFGLYLLPVAGWAILRLWRGRSQPAWRVDLAWMAALLAVPLAATFAWVRLADAIKTANPMADFLLSANLSDFNWGTTATRFSAGMWRMKLRIVSEELSWLPLLAGLVLLGATRGRRRWREMALCFGLFVAALVIFPVLYAYHDYYYAANTLLLMLGMGLAIVGLAESGARTWLVMLCLAVVCGGQAARYFQHYYAEQKVVRVGGDALSFVLRRITEPGDILIIQNQDWNSMLPYYAERRALMIRQPAEHNAPQLEAAFAGLAGETVGALVVSQNAWEQADLIHRAAWFGLETKPSFFSSGMAVFLPESRRQENIRRLRAGNLPALTLAPGTEEAVHSMAGQWREFSQLTPVQQDFFRTMLPRPARFYSSFGPNLDSSSGELRFGTHPVTRLVFSLAAGHYTLKTSVMLSPQAYDPALAENLLSDGVEITLRQLGRNSETPPLFTRLLNPHLTTADQGSQLLAIDFRIPVAGEVELFFGPGPQNRDTRDWISMGALEIQKLE
jgi:hypothetical protein